MVDQPAPADRWVAIFSGEVAGVGHTPEEALTRARHRYSRDDLQLRYIEPVGGRALLLPELLTTLRPFLALENQPVYLVGGAVRDALLGRAGGDLDFVCPENAIQLTFRIADALKRPAYVLDRERDAARVVLAAENSSLDFTRYRGPNLEADLADRDFTINSMALPATAVTDIAIIDPNGGRADLAAGVIRPIHARSLTDDPLRALRALRLAQSLQMRLVPETESAIRAVASSLPDCSQERIRDELIKLVQVRQPDAALQQMHELNLLPFVLPEIDRLAAVSQSPPHHEDVLAHTASVLRWLVQLEACLQPEARPDLPVLEQVRARLAPAGEVLFSHWRRLVDGGIAGSTLLRLGALFHDVGKEQTRSVEADGRVRFFNHDIVGATIAADALRRLALSNQVITTVQKIISNHMRPLHLAQTPSASSLSRRAIFRYFKACGAEGLDVCLLALADHLAIYDGPGPAGTWENVLAVVTQLLQNYVFEQSVVIAPPPLLDGRDLMQALQLKPGPTIGYLLRLIEEAQAAGELSSAQEAIDFARQNQHP